MLLEIIEAPGIPYDFAESKDHYTLRSLMLQFADQNGSTVLPPLIECTRQTIEEIARFSDSFPTTDITDPANRDFDLKEFNQLLDALSRVQSYLALFQALFNPQGSNLQGRPIVGYTMWLNVEENVKLLQSVVTVILRYISPRPCDMLMQGNCIGKEINFSEPCQRSIARLLHSSTLMRMVEKDQIKSSFQKRYLSRNTAFPNENPISATLRCYNISSLSFPRKRSSFSEVTYLWMFS